MENNELKKISVEQLKKIQLEILEYVADYCEKHNIHYWLDCGTLLGAVRHKGYIPWDDDIDIGMLRDDYDRFTKNFYLDSIQRFQVHCIENDPDFFLPHAKVYDTTTVLYEPDETGYKLCVNIDVFVYDNAPDNDELVRKMFDKRDALRKRYSIQHKRSVPNGNAAVRCLKYIYRFLYSLLPTARIEQMVDNSKQYANTKTKRVGNFTSYSRTVCDRSVFDKYTTVEFEGKLFKAPQGYDAWLHSFYGDYMQLPPPEKRVSHHSFIAYKK